ncbi:MAG: class I SAM-dependent methyltransferase [Candidatus Kapabacteria bacterium]|nr:class I SAM-dependent methyltransferase [Candidatus Kapabacteria bacterium]
MNPFSLESDQYALYRPTYPNELIELIVSLSPNLFSAWDVACGNGQLTFELSNYFEQVIGTDVSQEQLDNAQKNDNIHYKVESSSLSSLGNSSIDLITVAQAIHWFEFDTFYSEVKRVAKPNAIIAIIGYELLSISKEIDECVFDFYTNKLNDYWDERRRYIDEQYSTIPFPFEEVKIPQYNCKMRWNRDELIVYLSTWSAVKKYNQETGNDAIEIIKPHIYSMWEENQEKTVTIPIITKIARIK